MCKPQRLCSLRVIQVFKRKYVDCVDHILSPEDQKVKDSDLHLFVTVENNANESFIAWASACAIAGNGRPIFGRINFNEHYITATNKSNYSFQKDL